ncbi:MAG: hypothetical protein GF419_06775 [Ignavibacteriales bacterium]|nr:hypothetical protein [Ignavibacteriales bacterium]
MAIIPVIKDEGKRGDRDFLQWDTISLMSLLNVYVVLAYYVRAKRNPNRENKITNQEFDLEILRDGFHQLTVYHTSALHWNIEQVKNVGAVGRKAIESYRRIGKELDVAMHGFESAEKKIEDIARGAAEFRAISRIQAREAQNRELNVVNPKELLEGRKARITIENYLGGEYYLVVDEARIENNDAILIEGKHTVKKLLPSEADIKDGLLKTALYSNLSEVFVDGKSYAPKPTLKLTSKLPFDYKGLSANAQRKYDLLAKEARANGFTVVHK